MAWTGERKLTIPAGETESDLLEIGMYYVRPDLHLHILRDFPEQAKGVVVEVASSRSGPWFMVQDDKDEPFDLRHVRYPFLRLKAAKASKEARAFSLVGGPESRPDLA